jgi:hypothetical protein
MNNYQRLVSDCINDKLVDFSMNEAKSIYNIDILFHHYLVENMKLFNDPLQHYSKILVISYHQTIKEMIK